MEKSIGLCWTAIDVMIPFMKFAPRCSVDSDAGNPCAGRLAQRDRVGEEWVVFLNPAHSSTDNVYPQLFQSSYQIIIKRIQINILYRL